MQLDTNVTATDALDSANTPGLDLTLLRATLLALGTLVENSCYGVDRRSSIEHDRRTEGAWYFRSTISKINFLEVIVISVSMHFSSGGKTKFVPVDEMKKSILAAPEMFDKLINLLANDIVVRERVEAEIAKVMGENRRDETFVPGKVMNTDTIIQEWGSAAGTATAIHGMKTIFEEIIRICGLDKNETPALTGWQARVPQGIPESGSGFTLSLGGAPKKT